MTRIVIIGGSGHVGTYLVPRLVRSGFEVVNVSRGSQQPYLPHAAWEQVEAVVMDRETAVTVRGYAEAVASWFGQEANLAFLPFDEWKKDWSEADAQDTWEHISRSPNASIAKAQRLLNYQPRNTIFTAVHESLMWLIEHGELEI